jgi:hypothetical protein
MGNRSCSSSTVVPGPVHPVEASDAALGEQHRLGREVSGQHRPGIAVYFDQLDVAAGSVEAVTDGDRAGVEVECRLLQLRGTVPPAGGHAGLHDRPGSALRATSQGGGDGVALEGLGIGQRSAQGV